MVRPPDAGMGQRMAQRCLRGAFVGPVVGVAAVLASAWLLRSDAPRRERDITIVYVGAADCAPCRAWRRGAGADFRASPEFARLAFREVEAPTLFDVLSDEVWPADLRGYRTRIDATMGVPLWIVVADGRVAAQGFGATQWSETLLPALRRLLR
jgi:hypothetical protein